MIGSQRFAPYATYGARPTAHGSTEAGSLTQIPLPVRHDALPTTHPTGGLSETAANAENKQTLTEEDEFPVSNFTALLFLM